MVKKYQKSLAVIIVFLLCGLYFFPAKDNVKVTKPMETAIMEYILNYYKDVYVPTEKQFEVHKVYGAEERYGITKVYIYSVYGGFNAVTGTENQSGHALPAVVKLKNDQVNYVVIGYKEPQDGSLYLTSLKKMFPKRYVRQAINDSGNTEHLFRKMDKQVEDWLKER